MFTVYFGSVVSGGGKVGVGLYDDIIGYRNIFKLIINKIFFTNLPALHGM